ncbi:penicillin-binding transpeptidase domain-containing protein [Hymenobacter sp. M29]|uniref:Penicillin-binding transpeptidase domain-containing protein n=1 Tax=Hymenobacter mellowenesis TaxID=3063995 RepID=A0ABT9A544_9BACT|nr:penicillin-binding transpeptidase domain-containing protein [Hymenobacter sp. M29]MDO7844961.1 penicillin-binding transpeptidase domain-containing protein [Hymenobacter sp. M29]
MQTAFPWKPFILAFMLLLNACSSPGQEVGAPPAVQDSTFGPLTPRRVVSTEALQRGRVLDRNDSVLVATRPVYLLALPTRPPLDSLKLNRLLGWRDSALWRRIEAALPYEGARPKGGVKLLLTNAEAKKIQDNQADWPMLKLEQRTLRSYTTSTGAPILGYAYANAQAFLNLAQRQQRGRFYRLRNGGIESYYNGLLTGHRGYAHPLLDTLGQPHGSWAADTAFQQGQDLHLSIDAKLQAYAESLLAGRKGYLVALDPRTGEVLAAVSAPTFAPGALTAPDRSGTRHKLLENEDMPLLNRSATLANPPGSVFKLVNAAVALQLGAIKPTTGFRCDQSLINCVHHHPQARNLSMALQYSCNPYFYQAIRKLIEHVPDSLVADTTTARHRNLAAWQHYAKSFGLDTLLGVDLPREQAGFLPTPAFYDKARRTRYWKFRSIYSLSVGQGEINLTGLQMANMMAIIANRGWYYTPHFVRSIGENGPLSRFTEKHHTLIDSANFEALIPGMIAVMQRGGTAATSNLADVGITVAGKTGTVQNDEGDDHATFVGFAPADNPKIAIAVYLENAGFGATAAAPAAVLVIEKYLRGYIAPKRKNSERRMKYRGLAYEREHR